MFDMDHKQKDLRDLLERLNDVFGEIPTPPDDRIVVDNSGYHMECNQIRAKLRGLHWTSLNIDDLAGEADSLFFLTPEAFRFYLPAFVRVSLLSPEHADLIPDAILSSLAPHDRRGPWCEGNDDLEERAEAYGIPGALISELKRSVAEAQPDSRREEIIGMLSLEEKRALVGFVSWLRRHRSEDFFPGDLDAVEAALLP